MRASDQWERIAAELDPDWTEVRLAFAVEDPGAIGDAAAVLGPLGPGRRGRELRFQVSRTGGGPERLRNLLRHLDRKRIWGTLSLVDADLAPREAPAEAEGARESHSLVATWDAALGELPPGWRDLLCEIELESTALLPRAALLGAPLNPTRNPDAIALRFRVSSGGGGYGVSPGMSRRCLERMEAEGIRGRARVLYVLSDTGYEATQGPVWRVAGRSV
jgi:hypothetical protein